MENHPSSEPLGPRPSAPRRPHLSRARAAVLAAVAAAGEETAGQANAGPAGLPRLSQITGLHANTLREHLDALVADGLVRRTRAARRGRGRPAWLYEAVDDSATTEYAGLAATLAAAIHRSSPHPVEDAVVAGTEWGHDLARSGARSGAPSGDRSGGRPAGDDVGGGTAPHDEVVALLDRMGFAPRVDTATTDEPVTVHLTRCPLLDAARRYPDVVCGVHLGIAKGALQEYGADGSATRLLPFAEPGACVLHLDDAGQGR